MLPSIEHRIAAELNARPNQVAAAIALLDEGASVPFISRYRKEATGGLDDTQMRNLEQRLGYLRELEERRGSILASIAEQGKLTPELQNQISHADTKQLLEDLLPALQAEAPQQSADCQRVGAGATRREFVERPGAGAGNGSRSLCGCR